MSKRCLPLDKVANLSLETQKVEIQAFALLTLPLIECLYKLEGDSILKLYEVQQILDGTLDLVRNNDAVGLPVFELCHLCH